MFGDQGRCSLSEEVPFHYSAQLVAVIHDVALTHRLPGRLFFFFHSFGPVACRTLTSFVRSLSDIREAPSSEQLPAIINVND